MTNGDDRTSKAEKSAVSDKDERLLYYLAVIAGAVSGLIQHQETTQSGRDGKKTFLRAFKEPIVLAALITGVAATVITGVIKWKESDREFNQGQIKSVADQELIRYTKFLEQEQVLIGRVYTLVGTSTAVGDEVIGLTREKWRTAQPNYTRMTEVVNNYNTLRTKWISEALELEQLMGYYHPNRSDPSQPSEVVFAWRQIPDAMQNYFICIDLWFEENRVDKQHPKSYRPPNDQQTNDACKNEHKRLMINLNTLTSKLSSAQPQPSAPSLSK